jgi:hypothetical protein
MSEINLTALHKLRNSSIGFKKRTNSIGDYLWTPPEGTSTVRILPYVHQKDMPFVRMFFHFNFLKDVRVLLSPRTFGDNDPIDRFGDSLRESGDPSKIELADREYTSVEKFYCPILIRGQEDKGIKLWALHSSIFNDLVDQISLVGSNFLDLKEGRDINIRYSKSPNYAYKVQFASQPSQAFSDPSFIEKLKAFPNIQDLYKKYSIEEIQTLLDRKLGYTDPSKVFVTDTAPQFDSSAISTNSDNSSSFDDLVKNFDF